ncbi:hypothetical protein D3C71_981380 [compost metagenome]
MISNQFPVAGKVTVPEKQFVNPAPAIQSVVEVKFTLFVCPRYTVHPVVFADPPEA